MVRLVLWKKSKSPLTSLPYSKDYEAIIGIVDHDSAGLNCYGYLNRDYIELKSELSKSIRMQISIVCVFLFLVKWINI